MLSKNQQKRINALRLQKHRQQEQLFIAEGVKLIDELLAGSLEIDQIYAVPEWISGGNLPDHRRQVEVVAITQSELEKISALTTPNQVLAIARIPERKLPADFQNKWVLALDRIKDPGNLGTIIRTADWFGIDNIVAANGSVELWNPKVVQASMGSAFRVPLHYVDLPEFLEQYSATMPIYGTLLEGQDVTAVKFRSQGIVVIGNESHGISDAVLPFVTEKITIRPAKGMGAESLNASIATAIICYEIRRQLSP